MSRPRSLEVGWVTVAEGSVRTLTLGEGHPVVFIPSLGGSYELYEELVGALARERRVTVVEPFGTGHSDAPGGVPSTRALAAAVSQAIARLAIERFDLLGLSLGGMIAQWVAATEPGVRRLVLASTVARGLTGVLSGEVKNLAMARCLLEPDAEEANDCLTEGLLEGRAGPGTLEHVAQVTHEHSVSRGSLLWLSAAAARHDGREAIGEFTGPTLVLSGSLDSIFPPDTQATILDHTRDGRQQRIVGAGHDLALEAPVEMATACLAFFAPPWT